jgi:hypothetical protein
MKNIFKIFLFAVAQVSPKQCLRGVCSSIVGAPIAGCGETGRVKSETGILGSFLCFDFAPGATERGG